MRPEGGSRGGAELNQWCQKHFQHMSPATTEATVHTWLSCDRPSRKPSDVLFSDQLWASTRRKCALSGLKSRGTSVSEAGLMIPCEQNQRFCFYFGNCYRNPTRAIISARREARGAHRAWEAAAAPQGSRLKEETVRGRLTACGGCWPLRNANTALRLVAGHCGNRIPCAAVRCGFRLMERMGATSDLPQTIWGNRLRREKGWENTHEGALWCRRSGSWRNKGLKGNMLEE